MEREQKLRELAAWYRDFAEKAGNPWIWEARLRRVEELEREADRLIATVKPTAERVSPNLRDVAHRPPNASLAKPASSTNMSNAADRPAAAGAGVAQRQSTTLPRLGSGV